MCICSLSHHFLWGFMPLLRHRLQICVNGGTTASKGLAKCEAVLHGCGQARRRGMCVSGMACLLLFYTIATVFQLPWW